MNFISLDADDFSREAAALGISPEAIDEAVQNLYGTETSAVAAARGHARALLIAPLRLQDRTVGICAEIRADQLERKGIFCRPRALAPRLCKRRNGSLSEVTTPTGGSPLRYSSAPSSDEMPSNQPPGIFDRSGSAALRRCARRTGEVSLFP